MNGHGTRGWRERLRRVAISATLALFVVALPACEKPPKVAKTKGGPEAALAFFVDEEASLEARVEEARRRFLLAQTSEDQKRTMAELKRLDPDEVDDLRDMDAEELVEEREKTALEEALLQFYIAQTEQERKRAYEEVKRLDPDEAEDLLE